MIQFEREYERPWTRRQKTIAMIAILAWLVLGVFIVPAQPATVCQVPVLSPDGVTIPAGDPCLGAPVYLIPGSTAQIGLNDNYLGGDRDMQDAMVDAQFAAAAVAGMVDIYAQWIGQATAHDVWAEVHGVIVAKSPGWQFVGSGPVGAELLAYVIDNTEGERFSYRDPDNGWAQQSMPVPEPATASLLVIALGGLVWWRTWRVRRG
jgi:hypothetical protein